SRWRASISFCGTPSSANEVAAVFSVRGLVRVCALVMGWPFDGPEGVPVPWMVAGRRIRSWNERCRRSRSPRENGFAKHARVIVTQLQRRGVLTTQGTRGRVHKCLQSTSFCSDDRDAGGCEVCPHFAIEHRRDDRGLSGLGSRATLTSEAISDRSPVSRAGKRAAVNNGVEVVPTEPRAVAEAAVEVICR